MKLFKDLKYYLVKVYKDTKFVGYIKSYRTLRTGLYCFEKTKNIDLALRYLSLSESDRVKNKLTNKRDMLRYSVSYIFESVIITPQEIRFSKLSVLKTKKIKNGLFKNKE